MDMHFLLSVTLPFLVALLLYLLILDVAIGRRGQVATRVRVLLGLLTCLATGWLVVQQVLHTFTSTLPSCPSTPCPPLVSEPPDAVALETEAHLNAAVVPIHDPIALRALLAPDTLTLTPTPSTLSPHYQVGDRRQFLVHSSHPVEAELVHVTEHTYTWLVTGVEADREALVAAADRFEDEIYSTVHRHFGSEWPPGADDDVPISIPHYEDPDDNMSGFFSPDTEMLYVNLVHKKPGKEPYFATLAHELQHMIHWNNDRNEERWLDEGFSELAERLAGFDPGWDDESFREEFDTQLNYWPDEEHGAIPPAHYGASYRFALYLWERFGDSFIWDLAHHPANGMVSVDAVLAAYETGVTADEVFADWVVANAVDTGEYAYAHENWHDRPLLWLDATFYQYPVSIETVVRPYGTDYFELDGQGQLRIRFSGTTQARLLPEAPHSGETCWWSNLAHHSDTRLIHRFDLSGLSKATLRFWAWYDLKSGNDYVYLSVSGDGGRTWQALQGRAAMHQGDYGCGYTGQSDGWVEEEVDLSDYAGGEVWVRFDYVTHYIHGEGFLLDDLSIPELGLADPCEEVGDWQAEGFILAGPEMPVRWVVQVIKVPLGSGPVRVHRMSFDEQQTGQLELDLDSEVQTLLAISALARGTTEPATYRCEITRR